MLISRLAKPHAINYASNLPGRIATPEAIKEGIKFTAKEHASTMGKNLIAMSPDIATTALSVPIEARIRARLANASVADMRAEQIASVKGTLPWVLPTAVVGLVPKMLVAREAISKKKAAIPAAIGSAAILGSTILGDYLSRNKSREALRERLRKAHINPITK